MIQILTGMIANSNLGATRFHFVDGSSGSESAIARRQNLITEAGTFRKGYIQLSTAPGVGKSWTFTLMKNGATTAHVITISGTDTFGSDTSNNIAVAANDRLAWRIVPAGTPASSIIRFTAEYEPTTAQRAVWGTSIQAGGGAGIPDGSTAYAIIGACDSPFDAAAANRSCVWAINATIKSFTFRGNVAPGAGKSWTLSILKNGIEEASSIIVLSGATDVAVTVTGLNIGIVPGDLLAMKSIPSGTPNVSDPCWGISYEPSIDGQWNVSAFTDGATANFMPVNNAVQAAHDAVAANRTGLVLGADHAAYQISGARMHLVTAPGVGQSRESNLLKNGSATGIAMTVADTATTATDGSIVAFAPLDTWVWDENQNGAPANSIMSLALLMGVEAAVSDAYAFIT